MATTEWMPAGSFLFKFADVPHAKLKDASASEVSINLGGDIECRYVDGRCEVRYTSGNLRWYGEGPGETDALLHMLTRRVGMSAESYQPERPPNSDDPNANSN